MTPAVQEGKAQLQSIRLEKGLLIRSLNVFEVTIASSLVEREDVGC